jgi:hypothetical protein
VVAATVAELDVRQEGRLNGFDEPVGTAQTTAQLGSPTVYGDADTAPELSAVGLDHQRSSHDAEPSQARPAKSRTRNSAHAPTKTRAAKTASDTDSAGGSTHFLPEAKICATLARLEELSRAAIAGDTTAIDTIRIVLDSTPWIWQYAADLQIAVEERLVQLVAGNDVLKREAFRRRASELRSQLAEAGDSLLARMAISRVVASWLFAQFLELRALSSADYRGAATAVLQAERRWQAAVRTLNLVRRGERERQRIE